MCLANLPLLGQDTPSSDKVARAVWTEEGIVLDGRLSEEAWKRAPSFSDFFQKEPNEGQPATEETEVRVLYDEEAIYFGILCSDSEPGQIIATERRRDQDLTKDDSISIVLDTFHDHRNAFLFTTNALGTQHDALVTEEVSDKAQAAWDEKWDVVSRISEAPTPGWSLEMRIPFSILSRKAGAQTWGLEVRRIIRRKNEVVFWANYRRDFQFEQVSQAGHLEGLGDIQTRELFRVKPYLLAGASWATRDSLTTGDGQFDFGLEDLKYRVTPSMTLDLTYNTDFAQTEVDDVKINITRFPLFFEERREFFLEGAGNFDFGTAPGPRRRSDLTLFFSRRIGLSDSREPIPIVGGGKVSGKVDKFTFGILDMHTESALGEPATNFAVFRVKRDLLERSFIGAIFTNRHPSGGGAWNRVFGVDARVVFLENLSLQGFLARSGEPGVDQSNWAHYARGAWEQDFVSARLEYLQIQDQFDPQIGWMPRGNQNKTIFEALLRPRPNLQWIRQLFFSSRQEYIVNHEKESLETRLNQFGAEVNLQSDDCLGIRYQETFERLFEPFEIESNVIIPSGDYQNRLLQLTFRGNPGRWVSGPQMRSPCMGRPLFQLVREWDFFKGNRSEVNIRPQLKLTDHWVLDLEYALERVNLPQGKFTASIVNTRINYSFNTQWLASTTVQYDRLADFLKFRFRLNYIFRPGDDLFIVYDNGRTLNRVGGTQADQSLLVKWTYSFEF